jgi:hypothetical protein
MLLGVPQNAEVLEFHVRASLRSRLGFRLLGGRFARGRRGLLVDLLVRLLIVRRRGRKGRLHKLE